MYKPGGTIAEALNRIHKKQYVLPAIQREFVWKPQQIERLFDSLMQGYPFGTFLFWHVEPTTSGKFKFYDFVLNYHQRDAAHCPELAIQHNQAVTAVLDGQQRLTALNIGLRGSMAMKIPYKWWNSPEAFPRKTLCLNLLASTESNEDGARYDFRFLDDEQIQRIDDALWFKVPGVLGMQAGPEMLSWLTKHGLQGDMLNRAFDILHTLHNVVHNKPLINYYEEEAQDIERVLNIFIRLNSGGTVLSYSDLLLSVAVAQWKQLDARAEIHRLVDELNKIGTGFTLSQDFVLKAGLMLAGISSVGFKVENFTAENMALLEANWPDVRTALLRTVELAASFGMNGQTLRADSALLPIAYYLYHRKVPANYVTAGQFYHDRETIRQWLIRSLLKASGIWGSGLDTLLTALREAIKQSNSDIFPVITLMDVMRARGKSLRFDPVEIEDMLEITYGDKRIFPLLSLLFSFVDLRNQFHIDHIFPISRFSKGKLRQAGIPPEQQDELYKKANSLPNLQLLEGAANIEKQAALPAEWLRDRFRSEDGALNYQSIHELGQLPTDIHGFEAFYAVRRAALQDKLLKLLVDEEPPANPIGAGSSKAAVG
ncbi:DUF262 domain-containing protein [Gluconacetobacter sp.]|uniref:DUF262 domain-containing protein n=1 Tax=Gluconacetobacter sp. TaxID=1935994 RepID=UPI0039EB9FBB